MWQSNNWHDFEIIDTSQGQRLERWGEYILIRPDPQVIWSTPKNNKLWQKPNAVYNRSKTGGGVWDIGKLPEVWQIQYKNLTFALKPMGFKHTGLFPEQSVNWDWMAERIRTAGRPVSVLNLFAYTGGATLACAAAGASLCHVDASKGMVTWGRENAQLSGLSEKPIRWMVDDCEKFIQKEIRRGNKYDAIILDPPSFGRGPNGEVWKLEEKLYGLLIACRELLSPAPLFVLLNSYTTGLAPSVMSYMLGTVFEAQLGGTTTADEIGLPVTESELTLPCGATARWYF